MLEREELEVRDMMKDFLIQFTTKKDLLLIFDEFEKECQRRGIMKEPVDTYETNPVGRTLANLLAILCELNFDMKMWENMLAS